MFHHLRSSAPSSEHRLPRKVVRHNTFNSHELDQTRKMQLAQSLKQTELTLSIASLHTPCDYTSTSSWTNTVTASTFDITLDNASVKRPWENQQIKRSSSAGNTCFDIQHQSTRQYETRKFVTLLAYLNAKTIMTKHTEQADIHIHRNAHTNRHCWV